MDGVDDTALKSVPTSHRTVLQQVLDDRLLVSAFVVCLLLFGYQLSVTLLQPPWIKPVTDWVRAALAWPQMLVMVWVAVSLWRTRRPAGAVSWGALGMLSYAVARTMWTIYDLIVFPHGVPFPSPPDLFFILQYPCFVIGTLLLPGRNGWLPKLRTMLDGLLWMSAITALTWYFVLLPIALQTSESPLSKNIGIFYQLGDLMLLYALVISIVRPHHTTREWAAGSLVSLALAALFVGDTLAALQMLYPPYTYQAGSVADLFRFTCYLLLPLAALVTLRLVPAELPTRPHGRPEPLTWRDMLAGASFVAPSLAGVMAGVIIIVHATITAENKADLMLPEKVSIVLLLLATLRPAVMYLEQERLRRERDAARAQERALRIANERMEAFLSTVAHELKTPLTSLIGNVQLMPRRLDTLLRLVRNHEEYDDAASVLRALIEWSGQSLERMRRLVQDVLDETRVRQGRLALRLEACDLVSVVGAAVTEQVTLNPERSIRWLAETSPVPVLADADRIQQVVANFVSNALKFSRADQAVEVRVQTKDRQAWVSVHDDGVGVPLADQPHVWERYYQAEGADVQTGSEVGFGIGLYISKAMVEGHHGRVGVESAPGHGTTFWFTLPLAPSLSSPAPALATPQNAASAQVEAGNPAAPPGPASTHASTHTSTSEGTGSDTSGPGEATGG